MSDDAGPEHTAKHDVTEWLTDHGADVWWEESNPWGHSQFSIERETPYGGVPDLLVEIDGRVFVIEFKPADSVGQVYDSLIQLHGYWMEHLSREQTYIAGGESVEVDGFLTASKHSRFGRLFPAYAESEKQTVEDMDEGRRSCYQYGQLPPAEYRMTEQHVRTLWRLGKRTLDNTEHSGDVPHLGALLSDFLEREHMDPEPAVLWNKGRTNQDWEVLGE